MKVLYTSDTHVHPAHFRRLLHAAEATRPDMIIIGGDINPNWKKGIVGSIEPHRSWIRDKMLPAILAFRNAYPGTLILLDLGNDDIVAARELLEPHDGNEFHLLHRRLVKTNADVVVVGYMNVNPTPFAIKDWEKPDCRDASGLMAPDVARSGYSTASGIAEAIEMDLSCGTIEDDLEELSRSMGEDFSGGHAFAFVSHAPPRDTALDMTHHGFHVGSLAVKRFLENWGAEGRVVVSLHGHIHESPWQSGRVWDRVGGIPCFNIGQTSGHLRSLLFDTASPLESARLVVVVPTGEVLLKEKDVWF